MKRSSLVGILLLSAACSRQPAPAETAPPAPAAAVPGTTAQGESVIGPVLETMDAASYTYVRVKGEKGDIWAAAPRFPVKVGDRVVVPLEMPMVNFHSQTLNRDFPLLYFVSSIGAPSSGAPGAAAAPGMMSSHGSAPGASPAPSVQAMAPPPGGTTIAGVWTNRKSLAGKTVTVHGRVVKFNSGILGHNWIHLQDGTGKPGDGSNDITVTLPEDVSVKVGDTITVSGTVAVDKDFGAGYTYAVIVENGRVARTEPKA